MFEEIPQWQALALSRRSDLSEPIELYLNIISDLKKSENAVYRWRADFILEQINGSSGIEIFNKFREEWGISNFAEDILDVNDFKRGFLWCFRDHTTSWADNQDAKTWFLTSPEAFFVRRYEFWTSDNGFDECIEVREGNYREMLLSLLRDGDYEVLCSPSFSRNELNEFIQRYNPLNNDLAIENIVSDYIKLNPNY